MSDQKLYVVWIRRPIAGLVLVLIVFGACGYRQNEDAAVAGGSPSILLFNGTGVSPNDVAALQTILESNHLHYVLVNSSQVNNMSDSEMIKFRLLIVPGGNFIVMGTSLTRDAAAIVHRAVQHGLNYLGICAGGFLAGNSAYYNGFDLSSGVTFGFYAAENHGIHKAAVPIASPGTPALDQYWEDGPQFSGWGDAVAKYPDNTPAVTEGRCGNGYVILAGIHAEAPAAWRQGMIFNTPDSTDNTFAATLIRAALTGKELPHF